jgi:SAM-dependent methyltransferase
MGNEADQRWADDMAGAYERWLVPALFDPPAEELVARVVPLAPRDVLELAAGTGVVTRRLTAALPSAAITATDLNAVMVEEGERNAPGATWRQADAMDLPFEDGSFDVVVCQFGVMFFPDRPAALAEARRVLRPGGHLLVSSWDSIDRTAFDDAVQAGAHLAFPDDPPRFLERTPHGYHDPSRMEADARAGGFEDARAERCVLDGRSPSALDLARGLCFGSPLRAEIEARGGDLDATTAVVADEVERRLGAGPISGPLGFLVLEATKAV